MSNHKLLNRYRKRELERLFDRAEKIVSDKSYRCLKGMSFANNKLIVDIGHDQAIHIDLSVNRIFLFNNLDSGSQSYESLNDLNVLHRFFSEFLYQVEKINSRSITEKFLEYIKNLFPTQRESRLSSRTLFFKAELWYYKSRLSVDIFNHCFRENGQYYFELPDNIILHIHLRIYMTGDGFYIIEKRFNRTSQFDENEEEILVACKYLVSHPELLK